MPIWRNDSILNPEILKVCLLNSRNESVSRKKWIPCLPLIFIHFPLCHHHSHGPGGRPTPCLGSAVGSDLPKRTWFPSLWLSRKWRWVLNMIKQEERGLLWWFSPIFERKFWKASLSPQPKNNNKLCTLKCYRQPSRDREDQPIWGWSQSWQWCGRDQKMLTVRATRSHRRGTSLVVQLLTLCTSTAEGVGSILGWGTKIPHVMGHGQKIKQNKMCF